MYGEPKGIRAESSVLLWPWRSDRDSFIVAHYGSRPSLAISTECSRVAGSSAATSSKRTTGAINCIVSTIYEPQRSIRTQGYAKRLIDTSPGIIGYSNTRRDRAYRVVAVVSKLESSVRTRSDAAGRGDDRGGAGPIQAAGSKATMPNDSRTAPGHDDPINLVNDRG